jgi:Glutathione S-transferase, N-terminal domain
LSHNLEVLTVHLHIASGLINVSFACFRTAILISDGREVAKPAMLSSSCISALQPVPLTCLQRSVIAANELGVNYKLHPIELGKDNKADWYKAINPLGKVLTALYTAECAYLKRMIDQNLRTSFCDCLTVSACQQVPALQLGDDTVIESLVINEFLADRFAAADGGSALMPGI